RGRRTVSHADDDAHLPRALVQGAEKFRVGLRRLARRDRSHRLGGRAANERQKCRKDESGDPGHARTYGRALVVLVAKVNEQHVVLPSSDAFRFARSAQIVLPAAMPWRSEGSAAWT